MIYQLKIKTLWDCGKQIQQIIQNLTALEIKTKNLMTILQNQTEYGFTSDEIYFLKKKI